MGTTTASAILAVSGAFGLGKNPSTPKSPSALYEGMVTYTAGAMHYTNFHWH